MASQVSLTRIAPAAQQREERLCCAKRCPDMSGNQLSLFLCGNKKCTNRIHSDCYSNFVEKRAKTPLVQLKDPEGNNLFFCKVTCYRVGAKDNQKLTNPYYTLCWNEDGANGPDDPNNSETLLIKWMIVEGNYSKFRGNANGQKKIQIADQIARQLANAKVRQARKPKDVLNKIKHIELQFRAAFDYSQTVTGAGLKENDPDTFEGKILRMCPYYNELFPILATRSSSKALYTNEDDDEEEENGEYDEDEEDIEDDDDEEEDDEVNVVGVREAPGDVVINCNDSTLRSSRQSSLVHGKRASKENVEGVNKSLLPSLDAEHDASSTAKAPSKKRPTSCKKKNPNTLFPSSVKKPKKSATRDEQNQLYYVESLKVSQANKQAELRETARHNRVMEDLQKNKWQDKKEELEYKKKMVSTYMHLRSSGFDHEYIRATFPELVSVFPTELRKKYQTKSSAGPPVESSINFEAGQEDETSELSE